jgi:hypothetical protein
VAKRLQIKQKATELKLSLIGSDLKSRIFRTYLKSMAKIINGFLTAKFNDKKIGKKMSEYWIALSKMFLFEFVNMLNLHFRDERSKHFY